MNSIHTFRAQSDAVYQSAHTAWGEGKISYETFSSISAELANLDYLMRMKKRKTTDDEIIARLQQISF